MAQGTLTLFCGKMGAGKSTKAKEIARTHKAVLISEDEWLSALYPQEIATLDDYPRYSSLLKKQIKPLVQSILSTGSNVVMDLPANTVEQRNWLHSIYSEINALHHLYFLDVHDETCLQRIKKRSLEQPERKETDPPEMFEITSKYFTKPTPEECFNLISIKEPN